MTEQNKIIRCPWCGEPCECEQFPWTVEKGCIPPSCRALLEAKQPAMAQFRKIS